MKLYQQIEKTSSVEKPVQKSVDEEKTRNRQSTRIVEVYEVPKNLDSQWKNAGCVIKVERSGTRKNEPYNSKSYYLCSLPPQSRHLVDGIRGHWLIENRLHWVKDVIYRKYLNFLPKKTHYSF